MYREHLNLVKVDMEIYNFRIVNPLLFIRITNRVI